MEKLKENLYETVIATDDVPIFSAADRIRDEKASLHLLGAHYSGTIGKYMEYQSNRYRCNLKDNSNNAYTTFEITDSKNKIIVCHGGSFPYNTVNLADVPEFRAVSIFQLLQSEASYRGIEATSKYFGMKTSLPFEAFNLSSYHFCIKPFRRGEYFVSTDENVSYETGLQNNLKAWYYNRFPNNIDRNIPAEPEAHRTGWMRMTFEFNDSCGQTIMKVVKLYFMLSDHTFAKVYVPLTRWYSKDMNSNFIATVGLPGKQHLMNLPQVINAKKVVICQTLEDALAMQQAGSVDSETAYTAFICDPPEWVDSFYTRKDFKRTYDKETLEYTYNISVTSNSGMFTLGIYNNDNRYKTVYITIEKEPVIELSKTAITGITNTRQRTMTVKYNPVKKRLGYQIEYATDNKFKDKKRVNCGATSKDIGKLTRGTTYYVRVRSYARYKNGDLVYSKWSPTKKIKIKK